MSIIFTPHVYYIYTYPMPQVVNSMTDLYAFMDEANTILDMKIHGEAQEEAPEDPYAEREEVRGQPSSGGNYWR